MEREYLGDSRRTYTEIRIDPDKRTLAAKTRLYNGVPTYAATFDLYVPSELLDRIFDGQNTAGALNEDATAAVAELVELVRDTADYHVNRIFNQLKAAIARAEPRQYPVLATGERGRSEHGDEHAGT